jgi:hypothetical protein
MITAYAAARPGRLIKADFDGGPVRDVIYRTARPWHRFYQFEAKAWWISADVFPEVRAELQRAGFQVRETDPAPTPQPEPDPDDPWGVLGLQPGVPPELVKAVWKAWARKLHPDVGGDEARFRTARAAYERLTGGAS